MSNSTKNYNPTRRILLPVNRTSRRFLNATNKIRRFFRESAVTCIPCVEHPFETLMDTKKLSYHHINIIEIPNKNCAYGMGKRLAIQFHGSVDMRKQLLADYLRTEILSDYNNAVLLPCSISNFIFSNQIKNYIHPKFKSLEEQKQLHFNF